MSEEVKQEVHPEQKFGEGTVGVSDDELGKQLIETQLEHAENEIKILKNTLEAKEQLLTRYSEQWAVEDERWQIILKGFKKVEPQWEYEKDPRFDELQTKVMTYKYEEEAHMAKAHIKRMENEIQSVKDKIEAQKKEIEEIKEAAKEEVVEEEEEESEESSEKPKGDTPDVNKIKEALEKDIKDAQSKIVSEEVQKKIQAEREEARRQAMAEFEKEELAKQQKAEIERLKQEQEAKEREAAKRFEDLQKKIDEMSASKQVIPSNENPFKSKDEFNVNKLNEADMSRIEQESLRRFAEAKGKRF